MTAVHCGRGRLARLGCALLGGLLALITGCGGSHSSPAPGTPVITISATNSSFACYLVQVDSISFTATDGTIVSPLLTSQTIDLTRLTDLSELVAAPAVPSRTYTSASVVLDYTSASVWANVNGQPVPASVQSPAGSSVTTSVLTITFDPAHPLVITAGQGVRAHLNFDLAAFNTINTSVTPAVVTVQPFAVMGPVVTDTTPMRARGIFVTVQDSAFVINLRPFYGLVSALGGLTVTTSDQTYFSVAGVTYTGAAGLAAMSGLNLSTPVTVTGSLGSIAGITPGFTATEVYAGSSQESPLQDHIQGTIAARSGNSLTVQGATLNAGRGGTGFYKSGIATIASTTSVSQDGVPGPALSTQSISVGQRIDLAGIAAVDASGNLTFNATTGQGRLARTRAWGTLNSATPTSASLFLLTLGNYQPAALNFTGTGSSAPADPAAYLVNTGALDQSGTVATTLLAVDGFVTPFGSAPPDFTASVITPGSSTEQQLVVEWVNGGATAPFSSAGSAGLVVDLANANLGTLHSINTGPASVDLTSLPASPLITTVGADQAQLVLAIGNTTLKTGMSVYNSAADFATALNSTFNGTAKIYRLLAIGKYNSAGNTFVAQRLNIALQE